MTRAGITSILSILLVVAVAFAGYAVGVRRSAQAGSAPRFQTPYQAVQLDNGQVYFGKLEGFGTPFPVLRNVFYLQTSMNPKTNEQSSVLMKRGHEWHAPDQMVLNATHILLVEPVVPDSKVAELIDHYKGK
jgi:hypothetical protein